ncbi:MAG: Putative amidase R03093 [uncultured Microvirga sp.]|uniref:Indoleacetamide hydrolase n=1 Tax=uncultured Microvirga sp. TaxID=412392 RepID=A0A6J4KYI5_9HYPH|nr:MAG: Putative amidase R03093 [uncultured Microvirga sp.]
MTGACERLEACVARIAERPLAFTRIYREQARVEAEASDARRRVGLSLGPLDGRIVSIKDLFDVAGEQTLAGSKVMRGNPPAADDAPVVRRLRRAGAVIVGKTAMVEFAFSGLGLHPYHGTPGNAVDPERIPGGSSSGAGVSVGTGSSEISIGSDTAGSVRIPASLNGVVGFKPTASRVPLEGAFPLSYSLDSIGPLARSVGDCAAADAVMAGEEPWPLHAVPLAGLRIGVPRGRLFDETETMVAEAFEAALKLLGAEGCRVVDHSIEQHLESISEATRVASIAAIEAAAVHADWLESRAEAFDPRVRARIARASAVPAPEYVRMMRKRAELITAVDASLADIDVLALPTTPTSAPLIASLTDDEAYWQANALMLRNTISGNLFDLTAVSLPMPGLERPAGLMLAARRGHDRRLLSIAQAVETALAG